MNTKLPLTLLLAASILSCSGPSQKATRAVRDKSYQLEQVIVISRHNVRAPLSKNIDAARENVTHPEALKKFPDLGSNLTLQGGTLEMIMGQYFRMWLREEGLLPDIDKDSLDVVPDTRLFYFGASPRERTVASTRAFTAGFLPSADIVIHHKDYASGKHDPDYLPYLIAPESMKDTAAFNAQFRTQAEESIKKIIEKYKPELEKAFTLLQDKVGFIRNSSVDSIWSEVNLDFFKDKSIKEPEFNKSSDLLHANQICDALILQYYVFPDNPGIKATEEEWRTIAGVKDIYSEILFTAPSVAVNVSHGLLAKVKEEGIDSGRPFSFFCTHDTSISALLAALKTKPYKIENSIERLTPNGCKVLIEKYSHEGKMLAKVVLMYQTNEQLQNRTVLDYKHGPHPDTLELSFRGIPKDQQGYLSWEALENRIDSTLTAF